MYPTLPAAATAGRSRMTVASSVAMYRRHSLNDASTSTAIDSNVMSGGQKLMNRSRGSLHSTNRSKDVEALRPSDHAAMATPPARPASTARNNVAFQPRRSNSCTRILTASTAGCSFPPRPGLDGSHVPILWAVARTWPLRCVGVVVANASVGP